MKKSFFWYITLCALLMVAGVNGWNIYLGVAVVANALVVLIDLAKNVRAFIKRDKGGQE